MQRLNAVTIQQKLAGQKKRANSRRLFIRPSAQKAVAGLAAAAAIGVMGILASAANAAGDTQLVARVDNLSQDFCKVPFSTESARKMLSGSYVGQCKAGVPDGQGTVSFAGGDRYQGGFVAGKLEGKGTWTAADGSTYVGQWHDGKRHGIGTFQWGHGSTYAGDWFYDRRHGNGTLTWPGGDRFEGEFRNNKYFAGTFYRASGDKLACMDGRCR